MKFKGVIPALVTPVTKEGKLNVPALEKLVCALMEQGADGFYVGGATGEGVTLDADVHKELTREVMRIVDGKCPIIVHIARMNYNEMLDLAKHAERCGVDAISAIPPLFYSYGEEGIYQYYKRLADSVNIPVIIYNNPNTGVTFTPSLLSRLFEIKNLTGIKWTNYDFASVMQLKDSCTNANIINGPDEMLLMGLAAGCDACIGTTYNFALPLVKEIYNKFYAGDIEGARAAQTKLVLMIRPLVKVQVIMATRIILKHQGFDGFEIPLFPMQSFTSEQEADLIDGLRKAGMEI